MESWKATIKEKGNEHLLTPEYHFGNQFDHIKDERQREFEIRKLLVDFWGLEKPDVEWYKLERMEDLPMENLMATVKEEVNVITHIHSWWWGKSIDIVMDNGTAIVCIKFDEKSFPKAGYICDLSVIESERKKYIGSVMMILALDECYKHKMNFARLHVDAKNIWLKEWYERLGFKELSRDENELEMVKEL